MEEFIIIQVQGRTVGEGWDIPRMSSAQLERFALGTGNCLVSRKAPF